MFECHILLSRFCPVLYVHWIVAVLYAVGCVAIIVYHYIQIPVVKSGSLTSQTECNSCVDDNNSLSEVTVMLSEIRTSESAHAAVSLNTRKATVPSISWSA